MSDDLISEQIKEVYAHFGLAIYQAQCLEHEIVNALVLIDLVPNRHRLAKTANEWVGLVDSFMDTRFAYTLGRMIRALKEVTSIDPELEGQLANALTKRNWLAHSYFRERAETFLSAAGRLSMVKELEAAQEIIAKAESSLELAIKPAREKIGLTDEVMAATYARLRIEVGD